VASQPSRIPVSGIWYRHVAAGRSPLGLPPPAARGRWQRGSVIGALYLADSPGTAWAEFYRALAEQAVPPDRLMPRDLWSYRVELGDVADLSSREALRQLGLPDIEPDVRQWPPFQAAGENLVRREASGVLWRSAARPEHRALCVFAPAISAKRPLASERINVPPAPPRGMRT
jgi:RES domain-containing protein